MKVKPYISLFRVNNLLIIVITMILVRHALIGPLLEASGGLLQLSSIWFSLLVFATVMIAAAGYVINDVLDVPIDRTNRPGSMLVTGSISEKKAYFIYYGLNILGVAAGVLVSIAVGKIQLSIIFIVVATMLYYYSFKYKYNVLWGNIAIAFLSALVPALVWLFEFFALQESPMDFVDGFKAFRIITIYVAAYAAFAFLVSLSREIVKDIEDIDGDKKGGCRTLPIVHGVKAAKVTAAMIAAITAALLAYALNLAWDYGYRPLTVYMLFTVMPVMIFIPLKLLISRKPDFKKVGDICKVAMLLGILSMILIPF